LRLARHRRVPMRQRYQRATSRDAGLPQSQKSRALFWRECGMPNGSHGLPPPRPQSICNFALAGDAYSVSGRTVRSSQVAPWLSAGPSSDNVSPIRRLTCKPRCRSSPLLLPRLLLSQPLLPQPLSSRLAHIAPSRFGRDPRNRPSPWPACRRRTRHPPSSLSRLLDVCGHGSRRGPFGPLLTMRCSRRVALSAFTRVFNARWRRSSP
jgi:hypothetical protein